MPFKITIAIIAILLSVPARSQLPFNSDTVMIKEVIISGNKSDTNPSGYKSIFIDSTVLAKYNLNNLSELISQYSGISVKSYGMGGIATPSFRGTGAGHTIIAWNGINMNSPMLGQSDLSLLPVGLADEIQINTGGASMSQNSGGIGGMIDMITKPEWNKETLTSLNSGAGSFGRYSGLLKIKTGNTNFQSVTKLYLQSAINDFRYLNNEASATPVWETRTNSQVWQKGLVQELYYRRSTSALSAKVWYNSALRNIPSSLLTQTINSNEKQFDETIRTIVNYEIHHGNAPINITGAWFHSQLNYTNSLASVDSRNRSETFIIKTGIDNKLGDKTIMNVLLNEEISFITSNNYKGSVARNTAIVTVSFENKTTDRISTHFLMKEIHDKNLFLIPDFSFGLQYRLFDEHRYIFKGNISRNSKIPTMNDLYWFPGGNSALKNEYAYLYEFVFEMNQNVSASTNLKYDLTAFYNSIKNMIQWHPGEYSYWIPENIKNVNSSGIETSLSVIYKLDNLSVNLHAGYSYTRASEGKFSKVSNDLEGKQLIYVPVNQANSLIRVGFRNFYSIIATNYTGKRFTTPDNSDISTII